MVGSIPAGAYFTEKKISRFDSIVLQLSPERIICICQVDSCIRQADSLNDTLSQVHSSIKKFKKTIIMHELYILNKNL